MGYTHDIMEDELYAPLEEHKSGLLGDSIQAAWDKETRKARSSNRKPSLFRVLVRVFGAELVLYGIALAAMEFLLRLLQPLFLGLLLRYYSPAQENQNNNITSRYINRLYHFYDKEDDISWGEAVFFAFCIVFCSLINVMVQHPYMMGASHIGMKMRVGLCSLIYRKALKISCQTASEQSPGLVLNLMANDVNRFDNGPIYLHYLWIGPLETVIMTLYLYREMGMAAIYGSLVIFAVVPFQIFLGTQTAKYRRLTAIKSDERVRLMKEIIMGIEVIKMYTWEQPFRQIIDDIRREEIYYIKFTSIIRGIIMSFIMFTSRFGIFITTLFYVTYIGKISVEDVFVLACYYNITKQTMTLFFPQAVAQIAEVIVAIQRIQEYLMSEEQNVDSDLKTDNIQEPGRTLDTRSRRRSRDDFALKKKDADKLPEDVSIELRNASTRWIKSENDVVLNVNVKIKQGSLSTIIGGVGSGKSTILHMILKELPCSTGLLLRNGNISYASQEPWLFVGSVRQNILFGQPFDKARYMEVCKVCALERDLSLFPHGDKTVVGERGVSLSGGQRARINLARAVYKNADIYLLDDPLSAVDTHVAKHIFEVCIKRYLEEKTVILVTHQLQFIKQVDHILVMQKGKLIASGNYDQLERQELQIIKSMDTQIREVKEDDPIPGKSISTQLSNSNISQRLNSFIIDFNLPDQVMEGEIQMMGRVDMSVYKKYFHAGAAYSCVLFVAFMFILAQTCASGGDFWLSYWSRVEDQLTGDKTLDTKIWKYENMNEMGFMIVFGVITLATITVALARSFMFFSLCMQSSISLHDSTFDRISKSPMAFFHSNPSGRIINRFSKDMGAVDESLPQAMLDCIQIMLNLLGVIVVIVITDVVYLIPILAALLIFYLFRVIYIRTTSAIKRLEGITRSPVFSHLNATVLGMATVRSFGAETMLIEEFDLLQDLHSSAWYMFITCSRAFGYYLDILCLFFIICVTFNCLMKSDVESSNMGLAITQSISLTGVFQWGMRQSAEMENQMTSVERVLEYTNLEQEADWRNEAGSQLPAEWPKEGLIEFRNMKLSYFVGGHYVLNNFNFQILPREKIGIVGRTGAGKSSIIQALFRMAILEGTILIDQVDISTIGLHDLREKISIIPQEPVLFSGTMRKNLDPFDDYADEVLLHALAAVELISDDEGEGALYKEVSEGGLNFSVGQRQLVCLARAIVRNNHILVLDEATANVDAETDMLIQTSIRTHFNQCTVLTIAHRLNTIIDSDKVLVLDAGRLVEYDHPYKLLRLKNGYFRKMVSETGPTMMNNLLRMAEISFKEKSASQ